MFASLFSTSAPVDPTAPNIHPVSSKFKDDELFGELEPKDTEWLCAGGFATETQTFYITADDGTSIMCQVIHSAVGVWYPTIQFTFKIFDPKTGEKVWKSVNVSNFVTPPPGLDKRSSKADEFSITHKSAPGTEFPESYTIRANLAADLQLSFDLKRPASIPGCKVGKGPKGGYTYFGPDPENAEGYVIHRFWPRFIASGHVIKAGKAATYEGPGVFIHAIQGMRVNLVASAWNFANFHSNLHGGVSAIQMEFKTCDSHGRKGAGSGGVYVNIGMVVIGGKLVSLTAETKWPDEKQSENERVVSRATHLNTALDPETGYQVPSEILFEWQGPSVLPDTPGLIKAKSQFGVGTFGTPKGLIEKVDVLAEIPYVVKVAVNYVAGTKPFIYQWINPATLTIGGPDSLIPGLSGGIDVEGSMYNEATFIS
ncbi:oxidative stress survival Svf1-like protein [Collybia nuda]|uniref:Oxidative stress survival Svf1-like protein n=1 Tax=Collybia nuda TaxID=64659 RepID=A0A9P5YI79_9AGAR|nr:oxidative stress survival Svf1-like protein [Collybia nuda]